MLEKQDHMAANAQDFRDKSSRGNASQFFIAGELCRRGYSAVVTLGNTPNVDILCSNQQGTRFAHIQVKTFVPGNRRSEEHTSELQSRRDLVCRLLLEKKKKKKKKRHTPKD